MQNKIMNRNGKAYSVPREGELYGEITLEGRTFSLRYGYYEECDRKNPLVDPVPIYPNFLQAPVYNDEGYPFATDMQDVCKYFKGSDPDDGCYGCRHYRKGTDFIGICRCETNRKNE